MVDSRSRILLLVVGTLLSAQTFAQVTQRESVSSSGAQGSYGAELPNGQGRVVSADGRFVAFTSLSGFILPDTNDWDVFIRDRVGSTTEFVALGMGGGQPNHGGGLLGLSMSPDGRFVVFASGATNLVPGDANASSDIYLRDRSSGTNDIISISTNGAWGDDHSEYPSVSADGRYVAFLSLATNLVPGDTNHVDDIFVRDRFAGVTQRVSVATGGTQAND